MTAIEETQAERCVNLCRSMITRGVLDIMLLHKFSMKKLRFSQAHIIYHETKSLVGWATRKGDFSLAYCCEHAEIDYGMVKSRILEYAKKIKMFLLENNGDPVATELMAMEMYRAGIRLHQINSLLDMKGNQTNDFLMKILGIDDPLYCSATKWLQIKSLQLKSKSAEEIAKETGFDVMFVERMMNVTHRPTTKYSSSLKD